MDEDFRDTVLRRLRPTFLGDAEGAHQDLADAHVLPADQPLAHFFAPSIGFKSSFLLGSR